MSLAKTMLLGFIAGVTILIGLPIGRLKRPAPALRMILNAVAVGVLVFLEWDVLSAAWEPIDVALNQFHTGDGGVSAAIGYGILFAAGLAAGLLGLVLYERWIDSLTGKRHQRHDDNKAIEFTVTPSQVTALERERRLRSALASWSSAQRLALLIAVGIGLHNFAEGLAIGQASASGQLKLATLLVIGFGLHNATEGFGLVAPLATDLRDDGNRIIPSWGFLLALGAIGGGPTFIGTAIGHAVTSEALSIIFLTLAAGSILYVIIQLISLAAKTRRTDLLAYGLLIGLLAGFVTDAVVTAAGV